MFQAQTKYLLRTGGNKGQEEVKEADNNDNDDGEEVKDEAKEEDANDEAKLKEEEEEASDEKESTDGDEPKAPALPPPGSNTVLNQVLSAQAPIQQPPPEKKAPLRRGKWTPEEEAYASRLIQEFKAGLLPLTDGTTLRTFLSKLLNCDPMRISKKFVGSNCIGKQVFRRRGAEVNNMTDADVSRTRSELGELERKFLARVAQNKSSKGGGSSGKSSKLANSMGGMNSNMNKSAAAVGRALLQGKKASSNTGVDGVNSSAGGLLAQLQAQQPGMFDSNMAQSFLNATSSGGLGETYIFAGIQLLGSLACQLHPSLPIFS